MINPTLEDPTPQPADLPLSDAQLDNVVGGVTYTINLTNRSPGGFTLFQPPPTQQDQWTRDWLRRHWFNQP